MSGTRLLVMPMLAGGLAALGQAPLNWGVLMLVGVMAGFALLRHAPQGASSFGIGWRFGAGYFAVALHWIVEPFLVDAAATAWMAPFALVFMAGGLALFWGAGFALAARLWRTPLAFAASLALAELARAYLFTGFPWAMPSYAWVGSPLAILSSWVGPHGLNLILFTLAAMLVSAYQSGRIWLYRGGLLVAVLASVAPMPRAVLPTEGPVVRLVQPNAPQDQKWSPDMREVFFDRQLNFSAQEGSPDYVIWPETAIVPPYPHAQDEFTRMAAAAGEAQVITGLRRVDGPLYFNSLIVLDSDGQPVQGYDKHHLVPFGEYMPFGETLARFGIRGLAAEDGGGFAAGDGPSLLPLDGLGLVLPLICYEVVFPQDLRTDQRPNLLMQITNDAWFGDFSGPQQHLAQARMRALEQGLPMIRVANTGVSAVIDPWGNVLAHIPLGEAGYLDSSIPPARAATIYADTGDLPVTVLLFAFIATATLRRRRNTIDG